jgi:hypothetical protein
MSTLVKTLEVECKVTEVSFGLCDMVKEPKDTISSGGLVFKR